MRSPGVSLTWTFPRKRQLLSPEVGLLSAPYRWIMGGPVVPLASLQVWPPHGSSADPRPPPPRSPQPNLCYRDLHKALLLDSQHPETKTLLKVLVSQSQQAREEAGMLAVQGKLAYALQRINTAIENNPLDPSFFLFRY